MLLNSIVECSPRGVDFWSCRRRMNAVGGCGADAFGSFECYRVLCHRRCGADDAGWFRVTERRNAFVVQHHLEFRHLIHVDLDDLLASTQNLKSAEPHVERTRVQTAVLML